MDFFVNHIWEIIFGLVASGALGFCKYLHSQSKNYQKLLADKEDDNLRNTIQDELEPIIEEIHRVQQKSEEQINELKLHHIERI